MNEIKRHFYNGVEYEVDEVNKVVKLKPEFYEKLKDKKLWGRFGFKKIGGSSIGDVLKVDQYKSEFAAFARMAWIGLPILDRKYVDAGIAIEPKVIAAIEEQTGKKVTTYDPKKYNFDYFADKDEAVGGLPDGFIEEDKIVLEIKTTGAKNLEKWNRWGVPRGYVEQAQLYAYLMGVDKFSIVATFLEEEDYEKPEKYPIHKRKMKNWTFEVDKLSAQDSISKVKSWRNKMIETGVSPQWDPKIDNELIQWLKCSSPEEWEELKQKWIDEGKIK